MSLTVVQLLPALESGGVERGTVEVAQELMRRGHRAIVVSAGGRMVADLEDCGATHVTWPLGEKNPLTLLRAPALRRLLIEHRADIVHARSRLPAWVAYLAWRRMDPRTRPRFVTTVHGPYSVNAYSSVMTRGERVIAISNWIGDYILANYPGTEPACLRVIPRGVDPDYFRYGFRPDAEWLREFHGLNPQLADRRLLTLPARLSRRKGHEDFIALLQRLRQRGLPVHGLIVGGVNSRTLRYVRRLEARIQELGLQPQVTFLGPRRDVREIMAESAIVLNLATEPEGFGRTTVEALSLGRPVIGYDHSGVRETLSSIFPEGRTPVGDLDALAGKVEAFLAAPPPVPAQQPYTLRKMLDATIAVYEELARERAAC